MEESDGNDMPMADAVTDADDQSPSTELQNDQESALPATGTGYPPEEPPFMQQSTDGDTHRYPRRSY